MRGCRYLLVDCTFTYMKMMISMFEESDSYWHAHTHTQTHLLMHDETDKQPDRGGEGMEPYRTLASNRMTSMPNDINCRAAPSPAIPAPMMITRPWRFTAQWTHHITSFLSTFQWYIIEDTATEPVNISHAFCPKFLLMNYKSFFRVYTGVR